MTVVMRSDSSKRTKIITRRSRKPRELIDQISGFSAPMGMGQSPNSDWWHYHGMCPQAWKTAKGILLRKADKPDYKNVNAYRGISLLKFLRKVIEKIAAEANYQPLRGHRKLTPRPE